MRTMTMPRLASHSNPATFFHTSASFQSSASFQTCAPFHSNAPQALTSCRSAFRSRRLRQRSTLEGSLTSDVFQSLNSLRGNGQAPQARVSCILGKLLGGFLDTDKGPPQIPPSPLADPPTPSTAPEEKEADTGTPSASLVVAPAAADPSDPSNAASLPAQSESSRGEKEGEHGRVEKEAEGSRGEKEPDAEAPPALSTPSAADPSALVDAASLPPQTESDSGESSGTEEAASVKLRIGWHAAQGKREEMEDDVVIADDVFKGFLYVAVIDGHVGTSTVEFLKRELQSECMEFLEGGLVLEKEDLSVATAALEKAFAKTDERLLEWLEQHPHEPDSGATATAMFLRRDRLFIAHLGDCRAVLASGGEAEDLSQDHRPYGRSSMAVAETQRIKDAGGWVSAGRVCGMLAVSRAFGNVNLKTGRGQMLEEGLKKGRWSSRFVQKLRLESEWVSVVPGVYAAELGQDAEFVLIASDGLWDSVKSSEAVRFVHQRLANHGDVQASEELVSFALKERKSEDNVTVVLVALP